MRPFVEELSSYRVLVFDPLLFHVNEGALPLAVEQML
jgi:hypothetical protein